MRSFFFLRSILSFLVIILISSNIRCQDFGLIDKYWNPDGIVNSVVRDSLNNRLYVGGDFNNVYRTESFGAKLDSMGTVDFEYDNPIDGKVEVSISDGNGGWYIGGWFTQVGDSSRYRLAQLDSTGKVTEKFKGIRFSSGVNTLLLTGDTLFVGGDFSLAGDFRNNNSVRDIESGKMVVDIPEVNGVVNTSVSDGNGGVFIGGSFSYIGKAQRRGLAHINKYGKITSWKVNFLGTSLVNDIKLVGDTLFVGGSFNSMGTVNKNIAAIDKNTGAFLSWGGSTNGQVNALDVTDNEVFFGGQFTSVNGVIRNNAASCTKSTGAISSWDPNINNWVRDIKLIGNNVFVGGIFDKVGANNRNLIASFDIHTKALNSWDPNISTNPSFAVQSIEAWDSMVVIGGTFDSIAGQLQNSIAALDTNTGGLNPWNPNIIGNVFGVKLVGNELVVSGSFKTVTGIKREGVAKFDSNLTLTPLAVYSSGTVITTCSFGDNLFFGGRFEMQSNPSGCLTAIDVVGDSLLNWNTLITGSSGSVKALEFFNNTLYVGGDFSMVGTSSRNGLCAIDVGNQSVTSWNPTLSMNSRVNDLHIDGNSLFIGGKFYDINGTLQRHVAKFNLTNHSLTTWDPDISGGFEVFSIATDASHVYVGGDFYLVSSQSRNNFAQVDKVSASLGSLNPNPNSKVYSLKVNGNKLLIGGQFSNVQSPTISQLVRNRIAEMNISSGEFTPFNPNIFGSNQYVKHIELDGGQMYVAGNFSQIGALPRTNFVAYNYTTGEVVDWSPNPNGEVKDIIMKDSLVYIGGGFSQVDNKVRVHLAALNPFSKSLDSLNNQSVLNIGMGVNCLAIKDSSLFVGGSFNMLNGMTRNNLASFNLNTGTMNAFSPVFDSTVNSLAVANNSLFVGGDFSVVDGQSHDRVAEVHLVTGAPTAWSTIALGTVQTLHLKGTELIVGGDFSQMGGQSRLNLASISSVTGNANAWNPSLINTGKINELVPLDNDYLVGVTNSSWLTPGVLQSVDVASASVVNWNSSLMGIEINSITPFNDSIILGGELTMNGLPLTNLALLAPCNSSLSIETHVVCGSFTWTDGVTYYASDSTATHTYTSVGGCDSVVELHLTILSPSVTDVYVNACDSFLWNGSTYYQSINGVLDTLVSVMGCDSILNLNLTIESLAPSVIQNLDTLTAVVDSASYQWIDCGNNMIVAGVVSQQFIPQTSGSYKLLVSKGVCVDTSICYQVNVCNIQSNFSYVDNGAGDIDFINQATGDYTQVHWSFGDGVTSSQDSPNHLYQADGDYVVVMAINDSTAHNTCVKYFMDTLSIRGVNSPLVCQAGFSVYYDSVLGNVNVVNSSVGSNLSYSWDFGDGNSSTLQYPTHRYSTNGPFNLCLTIDDGQGCADKYCDSVSNLGVWFRTSGFNLIVEGAEPLNIGKVELSNNISIYPNPVNDQVNIEITDWPTNGVTIVVRDVSGKVVHQQSVEPISNKEFVTINTYKWAKGAYFVEVESKGNRMVEQIVVQ